jgi:REP element-mobilizing transposase RayT
MLVPMARQLRLDYPGALHHVTARGNAQESIVRDDADRHRFLMLLGEEILQQQWRCFAYCLMDNHYHLLVETPEPNLSRGMRRLNGRYTQYFNRRHHRVGHVLQGRFKSIVVERESYLLELCRYIVLNPVRAGLVPTPETWPWSSYGATVGQSPSPAWLARERVVSLFETDLERAPSVYRRFVADGIGGASPWSQLTGQIFLGSPAFRERMAALVPRTRLANVPRVQTDPTRLTAAEILERVATVYKLTPRAVTARRSQEAYQTAVWLLRRAGNEPLQTVAVRFGVSPSRVSKIHAQMESTVLTAHQRRAMVRCKVKQ